MVGDPIKRHVEGSLNSRAVPRMRQCCILQWIMQFICTLYILFIYGDLQTLATMTSQLKLVVGRTLHIQPKGRNVLSRWQWQQQQQLWPQVCKDRHHCFCLVFWELCSLAATPDSYRFKEKELGQQPDHKSSSSSLCFNGFISLLSPFLLLCRLSMILQRRRDGG